MTHGTSVAARRLERRVRGYPYPGSAAGPRWYVVKPYTWSSLRVPSITPTVRSSSPRKRDERTGALESVLRAVSVAAGRIGRFAPRREGETVAIEIRTADRKIMRPTPLPSRIMPDAALLRTWLASTDLGITGTIEADDYDESWGVAPTTTELRSALLWHLKEGMKRRADVLRRSFTRDKIAMALGVSDEDVDEMARSHGWVALTEGGQVFYPIWQFEPMAETVALRVKELREAFAGGPVELSIWAERPNPDLGGRTPREVLVAGDVGDVVGAARSIGPAAS